MKDDFPESFIVGPRGIRQDANAAMRNDIIRGLIEALTNADDAYGDENGKILIQVYPRQKDGTWMISVSDRASGIPKTEFIKKIVFAGERTSGHEAGLRRRGNRGRGAKDLAIFGGVTFETIGDDGYYTRLTANRSGKFTDREQCKATAGIRKRLGITRTGFRVMICCTRNVTQPRFESLKKKLQNAVALRQIMQSKKREVVLKYGDQTTTLKYTPPKHDRLIFDGPVLVPGYGQGHLRLLQAVEPLTGDAGDIDRLGGVTIESGSAVHEATLFGAEQNPHAQRLFGDLRVDFVDDLTRDFDEREEENEEPLVTNPFPVISRTRDGLEKSHPAYLAIKKVVQPAIDAYLKQVAEEASKSTHQTADTERRNRAMARALLKWAAEQEEEIESDPQEPGVKVPPFAIIPSRTEIECGDRVTFSIRVREDIAAEQEAVAVIETAQDPEGVVQLSTTRVRLAWNESSPNVLVGTFTVQAGEQSGAAVLEGRLMLSGAPTEFSAEVTISVVPPAEKSLEPPEAFAFASSEYNVRPGRTLQLLLLAPAEVVDAAGRDVIITVADENVIKVHGNRVQLEPVVEGGWYEADVTIEGVQLGGETLITARMRSGLQRAESRVRVREGGQPQIIIKLEPLKGTARAFWEETKESITVSVNTVHPAFARYFGPPPIYPYQNTLEARIVIAEAVADEAVRVVLRKEAGKISQGQLDIDALQAKRNRKLESLLPILHRIQISDAEIQAIQASASTHEGTDDAVGSTA